MRTEVDVLGVRLSDPVRVVVSGDPVTVPAATTLRVAAATMLTEGVGLVVVRGEDVLGLLSERDVVQAISEGADPDVGQVIDFATTDMASIGPETSLGEAAVAMQEAEIRHLVVMSDGELIGILSIRDLVAAAVEEIRSRS